MKIERLGTEEGLTTPMLPRHTTSSVVYNCKSPATPGKRVSVLLKVPTVMKGAYFPVLGSWYGAAWFHGMTIFGNSSLPNCIPLGIMRHLLQLVLAYLHTGQSCMSSWHTIISISMNMTRWLSRFLNVIAAESFLSMNSNG